MTIIFFALAAAATPAFGAPYPNAKIESGLNHHGCYVRYGLSTSDPIASVAKFYKIEALRARVPLFNESNAGLADYRNLTFIAQPRLLNVVIDRRDNRTHVLVSYTTMDNNASCRK